MPLVHERIGAGLVRNGRGRGGVGAKQEREGREATTTKRSAAKGRLPGRGMLVFPRELSRGALRSPPRDPLTYMQIYYVLAHLGLRNHVFYRPDQKRPFQQPPGDPRRLPAPPRGPPGTPPGPWRNPTEKTRHFGLPGWPEARVLRHPSKPGSQSDRENTALCTARSLVSRAGSRFRPEKWHLAREGTQNAAGPHGFSRLSTRPGKELGLI